MSLKANLMVLVISLLVSAILAVTIMLGWSSREGASEQTVSGGRVIAQLLSRSAGILDKLPEDVETLVGQQMLIQATFASHLVALSEAPIQTQEQLIKHLKDIVDKTNLDEITITDSQGYAYLQTNPTPLPFTFKKDMRNYPKESEFYPLLTGELKKYIQGKYIRDDQQRFKYAGVGGIDKKRIVQVGVNFSFLDGIRHRVGFQRLAEGLLETSSVQAIWIVDNNLKTLAYGAKENSKESSKTPSELELDLLEQVVETGSMFSIFHDDYLKVMAPVYGKKDTITGATIIHLPTTFLENTLDYQLKLAALVAVCVLGIGILLTYLMAGSLAEPVSRITYAASEIEKGAFDPHSLDDISRRYDELGKLSRVFSDMAKEVLNREERLDAMVKLRTKELEAQTKRLQSTLKELQSTQNQLVTKEKLASLGELSFGIAHELKNPLNFVINFSDVSAELSEELLKVTKKGSSLSANSIAKIRNLLQDLFDNSSRIKNHGKHAETIINSMIKHSAIKSEGTKSELDFNKFIESNLKTFKKSLQQKNTGFEFDINFKSSKKVGKIEIIAQDVNRLIGNILDNAHDAIFEMSLKQKKEYKPVIDIETWSDIEHVYFSIKDNGNGITNENIKKIFNPLFTTKTSKTGNTGMGLSLAYIIAVDRHHGDIKVESKVGQGAKFIIKLPRIHHKPDSGEGNSNE